MGWLMSLTVIPIFLSSLSAISRISLIFNGRQRVIAGPELGAEEEVPPYLHQPDHREVLVHGRDAVIQRFPGGAEMDLLAVDLQAALGMPVQPGHDLDQGGLPGAVVTQHTGHLTGRDRQVDPGQRPDRPVRLADLFHLDQRLTLVQRRGPRGRSAYLS